MLLPIIEIITGFFILIKSADWLVSGSVALAKRLGVSNLVVGLTVVAFGTSAPELAVNILASLHGSAEIAIGNILGSNISNILLILGISALIYPLRIESKTIWREIPFALFAVAILAFLANDTFIDNSVAPVLSRIDGFILMSFMAIFLVYVFEMARAQNGDIEELSIKRHGVSISIFLVIIGLLGLILGGKWVVDGAVFLARAVGASEALIGLTVVAIGTSLPELATSAVAAYKRNTDIAVGNIIGSNIFNVFWILGLSASIGPISFDPIFNFDLAAAAFATFLLFLAVFVGKKMILERWQGGVFVVLYIVYVICSVIRG